MSFLFNRTRPRSPSEISRTVKELIDRLTENTQNSKIEEELSRSLAQIKLIVQGTHETESSPDQVVALMDSLIRDDLLYKIARKLRYLPFEARKDVQAIFSILLRFRPPGNNPTNNADPPVINYIVRERPEVVIELCRGYAYNPSATPCGVILREAIRFDVMAAIILYDESQDGEPAVRLTKLKAGPQSGNGIFWKFFEWIDRSTFEVATDAFTTFRELLTRHKPLVSTYLTANFDLFFSKYNKTLIQSDSYVTKRQSIKLLGEILLDRANYNVMTAYVDSGEHLKLCMTLLRDDRKMVQYEGFHVFKVFVANPNKSVAVQKILINNRDRLLRFLPRFLEDRTDDDQFTDEKSFLVRQIELLPSAPVEPTRQITQGIDLSTET